MSFGEATNSHPTRWRRAFARASLFGFVAAVVVGCSAARLYAAQVWLAGVDPVMRTVVDSASKSDYVNLFQTGAPWSSAAGHVQVFKTSTQFLTHASDEQLRVMFADLKRRHVALAFAALMQPGPGPGGCGLGVESYSAAGTMKLVALRIKRLGGELSYVAMDEPLWFGHRFNGRRACHATIAVIAKGVASNVAAIRSVFPNVQVGDSEPFAAKDQPPDWLDEISQWMAAYRAATGENLAFFDVDVDWHQNWDPQFAALVPKLRAAGIKFGVIYDGDPDEPNGIAWTRHAEERFVAVESDPALAPDQAILQTWMRHPSHMLPESQPGTMTWLVNRYAAAATHITLQRVGNRVEGELVGPDGKPVVGQRLQVVAIDTRNAGPPADRTASGVVPAGAAFALFALRLNTECNCSGPLNVTVGPLQYRDGPTGTVIARGFAVRGGTRIPGGTRIVAGAGQKFAPNTAPWPVTPGDAWTVHVALGAAAQSANSGYVVLIFLREDQHNAQRITVPLEPATWPLPEVVTDSAGRFTLIPTAEVLRLNPRFRVEFAGNESHRRSSAALP